MPDFIVGEFCQGACVNVDQLAKRAIVSVAIARHHFRQQFLVEVVDKQDY
ncbi:MAG: hypothetical protein V7L20_23200 [Nostoc sp.]